MNEKILAIWLSEALYPGSIYVKKLIGTYGSFQEIYKLGAAGYEKVGIKPDSVVMSRLLDKRLEDHEKILSFCDYNFFNVIEYTSGMYPERLRAIKDPPPVIYARGRMIDFDDNVCIAVVGTRSYTDAGWNSVYKVSSGLASGGAVVVTGLASGIDTAATQAALEASGFAVGVLGSGVERIYPSENRELFEVMYKKGLVISEKAPFSEMSGRYFPVRNRLISGLCNGVLVGEGSIKSGAMHTAAHGSEQGRTIFAIPGDISSPESSGVNKLIRDGASPVFDAKDILDRYMYFYPHRIGKTTVSSESVEVPEKRSTKRVRFLGGRKKADDIASEVVSVKTSSQEKAVMSEKSVSDTKPVHENIQSAPATATEKKLVKRNIAWKKASLKKNGPVTSEDIAEFFEVADKGAVKMGHPAKVSAGKIGTKPAGTEFEMVFQANMENLDGTEKPVSKEVDTSFLGDTEKKVYDCICKAGSIVADSICTDIGEDPMNVNVALTALEMFGLVETYGPNVRKKIK